MNFHLPPSGTTRASPFVTAAATPAPRGLDFGGSVYAVGRPGPIYSRPRYVFAERTAVEFEKHRRKWRRDTQHLSSPSERYLHPSYARIIGLGWPAASLILRSLRDDADDWFYALRAITGENPVSASMAGDMTKMSKAWLEWGEQQGLI
jgi:hypothetical protein